MVVPIGGTTILYKGRACRLLRTHTDKHPTRGMLENLRTGAWYEVASAEIQQTRTTPPRRIGVPAGENTGSLVRRRDRPYGGAAARGPRTFQVVEWRCLFWTSDLASRIRRDFTRPLRNLRTETCDHRKHAPVVLAAGSDCALAARRSALPRSRTICRCSARPGSPGCAGGPRVAIADARPVEHLGGQSKHGRAGCKQSRQRVSWTTSRLAARGTSSSRPTLVPIPRPAAGL